MRPTATDRGPAARAGRSLAIAAILGSAATAVGAQGDGPDPGSAAAAFWNSDQATVMGERLADALGRVPPDQRPEWLLMFADILRGSQLGPGEGWFRVPTGGSRFNWESARDRHDGDGDGRIAPAEWPGSPEDYARLDRSGDGVVGADDFNWSEHALTFTPGVGLYYAADGDSNGKVTREEFDALFDRIDDEGLGFLSLDELKGLFEGAGPRRLMAADGPKGDGPSPMPGGPDRATLVEGLFSREIGSLRPGPAVGDEAPDFTLRTVEGDREVRLSEAIADGPGPLVLVFGNFTCGPFRSQAGNVAKLADRYADRAGFLMVYVREAHPTDGWHMADNFFYGYTYEQPMTYDGRVALAETCQRTLDIGIPLLVDGIDDPVGGPYSGMPARLYLIDRDGRVAFKSGRGPFGFKVGELEQALILLLNETDEAASPDEPAGAESP